MVQLEGFLDRLLGPLLKTNLSLMKNVLKPSTKSFLILLRLTAVASATDTAIQKKRKCLNQICYTYNLKRRNG